MMKMMNSKRWLALIMTVAMMCTSMSMAVFAEPRDAGSGTKPVPVKYYDENGFVATKQCEKILGKTPNEGEIVLTEGWYVIDNDGFQTISNRIHVDGDVHLVMKNNDGCNLLEGIRVASGNTLSIYNAVDYSGSLIVTILQTNESTAGNAAIGGNANVFVDQTEGTKKGEANGNIYIRWKHGRCELQRSVYRKSLWRDCRRLWNAACSFWKC